MILNFAKPMKFLSILILSYQLYYSDAIGEIPYLLKILYFVLDFVLVLYILSEKKRWNNKTFLCDCGPFILFFITSFLFGIVITQHRSEFLNYIFMGIHYMMLFLALYFITKEDKNCNFIVSLLFLISLLYMVTAQIRQEKIYDRLVISSTANANTLGNMCFISFGTTIFMFNILKNKALKLLLGVLVLPLSFMTSILSGSRKSFLGIIVFILLYVLLRFKKWVSSHFLRVCTCILLAVGVLAYFKEDIISYWHSTNIFARFQIGNEIDTGRINLYKEAVQIFKRNPFFGVSYQCPQFYTSSRLYMHSAYAEVLSGTGIIGFSLWAWGYLHLLLKAIKQYFKHSGEEIYVWVLIWIGVQMMLDTGSISLYYPGNFAILGALLSLLSLSYDELITKSKKNYREKQNNEEKSTFA